MNRVRVILLNSAVGPLDYRLPDGVVAPPGTVVTVPLGPRTITGVVWEPERLPAEEVAWERLRPIREVHDVPSLPDSLQRLVDWTAEYYLASRAAVLRMVLASSSALSAGGTFMEYRWTGEHPPRMTAQREAALEKLGDVQGSVRELSALTGATENVIRGLVKAGVLEAIEMSADAPFPLPAPDHRKVELTDEQATAADELCESVRNAAFDPIMLDGVTGSGKTEVYFEAIAEALRKDRQILVLLPEIALTQPFLSRFEQRFGCEPVSWHSGMRSSERRRAWRALAHGEAKVVVGARSALFLPYPDLGLIVVDEAHETSFKQEDGVRYHARDVAVMRAMLEEIPIVLASATPAIETRHLASIGKYRSIEIASRFGGATLPEMREVDLLRHPPPPRHWLSPVLVEAIEERLERGEQSLLFLNRRGFAPLTLCRHCGHRIRCPNCTAWMVEHRLVRRLACHHCGHVMPPPQTCPECGEEDSLVACGPGVERIADEIGSLFPEARTVLATSDTLWSPAKAADFVARVEAGAVDIIVGTQLVTKGYHFPNLTLVGVVDADLGLEGGDLRAAERTFQQIAQVAGRAGRADKPGEVLIQTRNPDAHVIQALVEGDRDGFYQAETDARREAGAPPFGRLAAIVLSSEDEKEVIAAARLVGETAPVVRDMVVLGPAPAPLSMLRGRHRQRLLVHARRNIELQEIMAKWLGALDLPSGVRLGVDVDPYNFL